MRSASEPPPVGLLSLDDSSRYMRKIENISFKDSTLNFVAIKINKKRHS